MIKKRGPEKKNKIVLQRQKGKVMSEIKELKVQKHFCDKEKHLEAERKKDVEILAEML